MRALGQLLDQRPLPQDYQGCYVFEEDVTRHWLAQVARGLDYLHDLGIVHNDIHDGNILYKLNDKQAQTFDDRVLSSTFKLADFGMAIDRAMPDVVKTRSFADDIKTLSKYVFTFGMRRPNNLRYAQGFSECKIGPYKDKQPAE